MQLQPFAIRDGHGKSDMEHSSCISLPSSSLQQNRRFPGSRLQPIWAGNRRLATVLRQAQVDSRKQPDDSALKAIIVL